jgi:hypothetical protein
LIEATSFGSPDTFGIVVDTPVRAKSPWYVGQSAAVVGPGVLLEVEDGDAVVNGGVADGGEDVVPVPPLLVHAARTRTEQMTARRRIFPSVPVIARGRQVVTRSRRP